MRTLILMTVILLSITSCTISKEKSVEEYMKANLQDPESYELIGLEFIDKVNLWQLFRIDIQHYETLFIEQRDELNRLYSLHGKYSNKAQPSKLQFEETQATLLDIHKAYNKMIDKLDEGGADVFNLTYNSRNELGDLVEESKIVVLKNNSKREVFRFYDTASEAPKMLKPMLSSIIESEITSMLLGDYYGIQSSYYVKGDSGRDIVVLGNKVSVPSSSFKFSLMKNKVVSLEHSSLEGNQMHFYSGSFKILSNESNLIKVEVSVSDGQGSSPTYILEINKSNKKGKYKGGDGVLWSPDFPIEKIS